MKYRLIGLVILVILAVVILPGLLDGNKLRYEESSKSIPLMPKASDDKPDQDSYSVDSALPEDPDTFFSHYQEMPFAQEGSDNNRETKPDSLSQALVHPVTSELIDKNTQIHSPQIYIVQLATLTNIDSINSIIAQLRLSNFRVYTIPQTPIQGQNTRLLVGPFTSKEKAQSALVELKKLTKLEGQIRLFNVESD